MQGILLVNKKKGKTSFSIISQLRRKTKIKKIGHCGTLDPLAQGVMVLLIGKEYTKLSQSFLEKDKEYLAELTLGKISQTYDGDGPISPFSSNIPSEKAILNALASFQGVISQKPPMFSAKKIKGKKLYELARKGIEIDRPLVKIFLQTTLITYSYPLLKISISCSKGTYIRSIAHDLGQILGCGAFLSDLTRTRSGSFLLQDCIEQDLLEDSDFDLEPYLKK